MSGPTLVCFAVPQEAKLLRKWAYGSRDIKIAVTGMGPRNAERAIKNALQMYSPARAFTCGFAGALNPALRIGDVVFDRKTTPSDMAAQFVSFGARPATFHCAKFVAVTAAAKAQLHNETSADAVEMESQIIHSICTDRNVPCVTVRAISDTASEALPLDFNALLDAEEQLSAAKLAFAILRAPHKIPALMRLGRNSAHAARELSRVLSVVLER